MTEIRTLGFQPDQAPVIITLISGQQYTALVLDWLNLRQNWPAPNGLMVEVDDPTLTAPDGQRLRVFVPWWNIRMITQVIPAQPTESPGR